MQNEHSFKFESLYNEGDKVRVKENGIEGVVKSADLIHKFVTITDGENVYWTGGFKNTCCINFEDIEKIHEEESFEDAMTKIAEESAVESFEDFAARTQTTDNTTPVTYTEQEKLEMLWDAENAEHQKAIDEQNELHR